MSTIQNDLKMQEDVCTKNKIKLPSIFFQVFSVDNHHAKCKKCNIICMPESKDILFHSTICNGSLVNDKIKTTLKFNCLLCSFETGKFKDWQNHVFKLKHISENVLVTKYSYDCNSCNTHFYGYKDIILKHQCKPKSLSILSELLAYAFKSFNFQQKHMLYFCLECEHYSHNVTDLHVKKCNALLNAVISVCESCLITFYDSSKKTFLDHKTSSEHLLLSCLNGKRTKIKEKKINFKLPIFINKYFELSILLRQVNCIVCNTKHCSSYESIYGHFKKCISSNEISIIDNSTPLNTIVCNLCNYNYCTADDNVYINWVNHVISYEHLSKTSGPKKKKFYSYYCSDTKTILYGTEWFINSLIHQTNRSEHSLFVSKVMGKVYRCSKTYLNCSVLFACGFCQKVEIDQSKNCEHENIDSSQLFYCSTCLVKFNVKTDYTKHLLCCEHIIIKYYKPNQTSQLRYLEHSLKTMKLSLSNLNESDDNDNEYFLSIDQNSNNEDICVPLNCNNIESQNVLDELHSSSHFTTEKNMGDESKQNRKCEINKKNKESSNEISSTSCVPEVDSVLNCMSRLSEQSQKSALNNYLRMKFELLNQMPHAIDVFSESKSFYCAICDSVFCDHTDWNKHYSEFHDKINNPLVFYCAICHIYHISISSSIRDHIQTIEHNIMLEFQESMRNNASKLVVNNIDNSSASAGVPVSKEENKCETDQISKKIKKNENTYIEIKDIPADLKRNNYAPVSHLIKEKYGNFSQISNKSNSFIILFDKTIQVNDFINDKEKLEKQYGFKLQVLGQDKELSSMTKELFCNWKSYKNVIRSQLINMKLNGSEDKVKQLCDSVRDLNIGSDSIHVHVFGSRLYELATENSDVDIYLDIGDTFDGVIVDDIDRQVDLVKMFAQQCYLKCDEFKNVEEICDARVPIIKFYHVPTKFNCDVSFKSGLSVYKSKLIKLYLSMHSNVKWLVCGVKFWALENNLIDKNLFTSYALVWLVLFYLMTENIIPPLAKLMKNATNDDHKIIEGWDCTFGKCEINSTVPSHRELLLGFFQYYANKRQLKNHVLSPFTGKKINKNKFFKDFRNKAGLSNIQREKFKRLQSKVNSSFVNNHGLAIHDPFELAYNITKQICSNNLADFCGLCDQSETLLSKNSKI